MAGYSGTPLSQKLGLREGMRTWVDGMPGEVRQALRDHLARTRARAALRGPLDWIHVFVTRRTDLDRGMPRWRAALDAAGQVWVSWPKRASGVETDVTEDVVRAAALAAGLVDVKVCAVDQTWSGLKLVVPVKDRPADRAVGARARPPSTGGRAVPPRGRRR